MADVSAARVAARSGSCQEPNFHQLRSFLVLVEELHFGRAATRLFMTQPALSRQIRALESRLGVQLVERSSRRVEMTAAGEALAPQARAVLDAMTTLRDVAAKTREVAGRLVVGFIGAEAAMPYNRAVLAELRALCPNMDVHVRNLDFSGHLGALTRGEVDVAFSRPPVPPGIETLRIATEPRVACLPADDPLGARTRVTLADLAGRAVADVPPECPRAWGNFLAVDPRPDGAPVRYGPVVADMETLLLAVSAGEAVSFLPATAQVFFPRPGVSYVRVADAPPTTAALVWLPKNRTLPTVTAIRRAAHATVRRATATQRL